MLLSEHVAVSKKRRRARLRLSTNRSSRNSGGLPPEVKRSSFFVRHCHTASHSELKLRFNQCSRHQARVSAFTRFVFQHEKTLISNPKREDWSLPPVEGRDHQPLQGTGTGGLWGRLDISVYVRQAQPPLSHSFRSLNQHRPAPSTSLLRLLLPLNDRVWIAFRPWVVGAPVTSLNTTRGRQVLKQLGGTR